MTGCRGAHTHIQADATQNVKRTLREKERETYVTCYKLLRPDKKAVFDFLNWRRRPRPVTDRSCGLSLGDTRARARSNIVFEIFPHLLRARHVSSPKKKGGFPTPLDYQSDNHPFSHLLSPFSQQISHRSRIYVFICFELKRKKMVEIHGEERNIDDRMTLAQPIRYFNHPRRAVIAVRRRLDSNSVVTVATGADATKHKSTAVSFIIHGQHARVRHQFLNSSSRILSGWRKCRHLRYPLSPVLHHSIDRWHVKNPTGGICARNRSRCVPLFCLCTRNRRYQIVQTN